ncbi:MAG: aminotransferase class V-fold PLP-dependent enzyme [Planctomycetes bacterium]|nr:aminotransferase class V-fold PLP-dependent enzyme [Planctomycetota bacterium]
MPPVYLDHAATTPLAPEVREAMAPFLAEAFGNPSSVHRLGGAAREALERARGQVARAIGAGRDEVVLTSGGTEANNLAVLGLARARAAHGRHVVVGPTEHPSVRAAAEALVDEGFEVERAPLDAAGALDLAALDGLLRADTVLVAQMLVCNQFGIVYPAAEVARRVRARAPRAALHVDAVQALGKLDVRVSELDADTLALSAHKLRGPKGSGALYVRKGCALRPLVFGGGQERGLRAGTEHVAGAVGLGAAVERAAREQPRALERLAARARAWWRRSRRRAARCSRPAARRGSPASWPSACPARRPRSGCTTSTRAACA